MNRDFKSVQTQNLLTDLGKVIKSLRDTLLPKKSNSAFGKSIGNDHSYVFKIENGKTNLSVDKICQIADQFDMDVNIVFRKRE